MSNGKNGVKEWDLADLEKAFTPAVKFFNITDYPQQNGGGKVEKLPQFGGKYRTFRCTIIAVHPNGDVFIAPHENPKKPGDLPLRLQFLRTFGYTRDNSIPFPELTESLW